MQNNAPSAQDWDALDIDKFADEDQLLIRLLDGAPLSPEERSKVAGEAALLVVATRRFAQKQGVVESFLKEFSLGTREGLALMCLAEALLRIPDAPTKDRLIAEKILQADWASHLGRSERLFVNASTWGLMLTGKLVDVDDEAKADVGTYVRKLTLRVGEPVIRQAVAAAVRIMGEQFVLGRDIGAALARAKREKMLCSFDMLGEGARTAEDAAKYARIYAEAITAVGEAADVNAVWRADPDAGPDGKHGISVKLSALCPRYETVKEPRVWDELYPVLRDLACRAAQYNLNFTIDAEEADRLVLSLKLVEKLAGEPALDAWQGLGVVVQAYQKRAIPVITALAELACRRGRRIMVRLVKGAYWDSEIKRAQVAGMEDYPVFTTKAATDLSYLVCADALIAASPHLAPQFASHNAHSLAAVRHMATRAGILVEHQRLHGMGEALYRAAGDHYGPLRVRAYAPVGGHEELLPYLVRRLLENGANSSFVHALLDETIAPEQVVRCPIATVLEHPSRHGAIARPCDLYGPERRNPPGRDMTQSAIREICARSIDVARAKRWQSAPMIANAPRIIGTPRMDRTNQVDGEQPVFNPSDGSIVGVVTRSSPDDIDKALASARAAWAGWDRIGGAARAAVLRACGDALEGARDALIALLVIEAGKTLVDALSEVREAVDFCRYYAGLAETQFGAPLTLPGPVGESNRWQLSGRGVFVCISPWNFPLAIFTGQIMAALAAGNAVLAKPAEQTPLIAAEAVRLFHKAGLGSELLALLPGDGATVGAALVAHPGIDGVAFTGGTETARAINRSLAARDGAIVPFIAETGGLNAMFVDTTALKEQVVDDVILSAFGSAGQRCSALRMLFLPETSADAVIEGLTGAMEALDIGDPALPFTDIGPVIDAEAKATLEAHVVRLEKEARIIARHKGAPDKGHFFAPIIAEVPTPDFLEREVFGPILHIYRYRADDVADVARKLAARGFGLTLGIHSRIERFAREISALVPAGNIYINRAMTGAVVGVQPFGGTGLSGTGPKAGGPHALYRYAHETSVSVNIMAQGGDPSLLNL